MNLNSSNRRSQILSGLAVGVALVAALFTQGQLGLANTDATGLWRGTWHASSTDSGFLAFEVSDSNINRGVLVSGRLVNGHLSDTTLQAQRVTGSLTATTATGAVIGDSVTGSYSATFSSQIAATGSMTFNGRSSVTHADTAQSAFAGSSFLRRGRNMGAGGAITGQFINDTQGVAAAYTTIYNGWDSWRSQTHSSIAWSESYVVTIADSGAAVASVRDTFFVALVDSTLLNLKSSTPNATTFRLIVFGPNGLVRKFTGGHVYSDTRLRFDSAPAVGLGVNTDSRVFSQGPVYFDTGTNRALVIYDNGGDSVLVEQTVVTMLDTSSANSGGATTISGAQTSAPTTVQAASGTETYSATFAGLSATLAPYSATISPITHSGMVSTSNQANAADTATSNDSNLINLLTQVTLVDANGNNRTSLSPGNATIQIFLPRGNYDSSIYRLIQLPANGNGTWQLVTNSSSRLNSGSPFVEGTVSSLSLFVPGYISSTSAAGDDDDICVIERALGGTVLDAAIPALRGARDLSLGTGFGRMLSGLYYGLSSVLGFGIFALAGFGGLALAGRRN